MDRNSYTATILVEHSPGAVFKRITDVSKWWGGKDLEGSATTLGDEFTIRHGDVHYSKQKLIEFIPGRKLVWLITESKLNWLQTNKHEWTNTRLILELTARGDKTTLRFTHEGLVPGLESYSRCAQGWEMVIKEWLFEFINTGKAHFPEEQHNSPPTPLPS